MRVKCAICDHVENLDDNSLEAKRLRNHRETLYLCEICYERIRQNTEKRHATGNFHLYRDKKSKNHFI